jgi:serine/threonine-protein kinase ULK2
VIVDRVFKNNMAGKPLGDYIVTEKIGRGSFASVHRGYHKKTKQPVAIKAISKSRLSARALSHVTQETEIMEKSGRHPNIVRYITKYVRMRWNFAVYVDCVGA